MTPECHLMPEELDALPDRTDTEPSCNQCGANVAGHVVEDAEAVSSEALQVPHRRASYRSEWPHGAHLRKASQLFKDGMEAYMREDAEVFISQELGATASGICQLFFAKGKNENRLQFVDILRKMVAYAWNRGQHEIKCVHMQACSCIYSNFVVKTRHTLSTPTILIAMAPFGPCFPVRLRLLQ